MIIGASVTDLPNAINVPLVSLQDAEQLMESTVKQFDGALDGRVRAWTMPADVSSSSKELLQAAKRIADENGTRMTIHCVNSPQAVEAFLSNYGRRPIEWLEDIGVLGPNLLLAHVVGLNDSEVDCVARTDTKMVMCPTAAVKMGAGTSSKGRLPEMLENGVTVGLGTDSANNSCVAEVLRSMYLAAVLYKDGRARPAWSLLRRPWRWPQSTVRGPWVLSRTSAHWRRERRPISSCSTPAARSGAPCSTPSTAWYTMPMAGAFTRFSWMAGSWSRTRSQPTWTSGS